MPGGAYLDSAMKFRTTMSAQSVLRIGILAAGLALTHSTMAKTSNSGAIRWESRLSCHFPIGETKTLRDQRLP